VLMDILVSPKSSDDHGVGKLVSEDEPGGRRMRRQGRTGTTMRGSNHDSSPPVSPSAIQTCLPLLAGFRAGEWASVRTRLDLRRPMQSHSGIVQILNLAYRCGGSAGIAVPAERRTDFPFKSANDHLQIPEADYRRSIGLRLRNCKTIMPSCARR
jgi:hypothetical protein